MIPVKAAKELISANCLSVKTGLVPLQQATGLILAEPVCSPIDTPPFNQSAMDGYAFSFEQWDGRSSLAVMGEIQAGNSSSDELQLSEAVRIYTGAPLPPGADTVVIQEKVLIAGKSISIRDEQLRKGHNVRVQGSQIKKGEITLPAGHYLTPAAIAFLAGTGIDQVKVFANPRVSIIVTGKELLAPGHPLTDGKIYESNSYGLLAALQQLSITPVSVEVVDDREDEIFNAITRQLDTDLVILTGGISVGDYDFVATVLGKCGVKTVFHKVRQKPGKPLYFGTRHQTLVFALPGNPAAVLTCFYEYVMPAISHFTKREYFRKAELPLAGDFTKKRELTYFLKGKTMAGAVSVLNNQESYMMNSFAMADCIIELEEDKEHFKCGDPVSVQLII